MNIIRGFATTFKHILEEPVTLQYPEQVRPFQERFKGRHHLRRYDNGLEKCIGCSLCAAACPADAIWVEAAENTDEVRFSPGERYAKTYEINMLRCIFCGYCEDACPTQAIELGHEHRGMVPPMDHLAWQRSGFDAATLAPLLGQIENEYEEVCNALLS